jgi:hypothetical protein
LSTVYLSMYSITENIYCSQLSSVTILLQPEPDCFTSYNTRKRLCFLPLCAIVFRSPPASHVSSSTGQWSSQLFCVYYVRWKLCVPHPLSFRNFFFAQCVLIGFVWFWEQTAIISLNSINQLIFVIMKCSSILFAVRTGCLNVICMSSVLERAKEWHVMAAMIGIINA